MCRVLKIVQEFWSLNHLFNYISDMKKLIRILVLIALTSCGPSQQELEIKNIRNTSIDGRICRSPEIRSAWNLHLIAEEEAMLSAQAKGLPTASIKAIFYTDTTGFFYDLKK